MLNTSNLTSTSAARKFTPVHIWTPISNLKWNQTDREYLTFYSLINHRSKGSHTESTLSVLAVTCITPHLTTGSIQPRTVPSVLLSDFRGDSVNRCWYRHVFGKTASTVWHPLPLPLPLASMAAAAAFMDILGCSFQCYTWEEVLKHAQ